MDKIKSPEQRIKELEAEIRSLRSMPWDLVYWQVARLNYELMMVKKEIGKQNEHSKSAECSYFNLKWYKKGTMHFEFKDLKCLTMCLISKIENASNKAN